MKLHSTADGWFAHDGDQLAHLPAFDMDQWLAMDDPCTELHGIFAASNKLHVEEIRDSLPMRSQEVWAAGVTYLRSRAARMEESQFGANAYDRVYDAPRPELFFKATARRCVGHGQPLRLRDDSKWIVPEPELALLIAANGRIVGYTIGDDLSCRDIEGENLLYLPQAKVWDGCCALGPCILVDDGHLDIRRSSIHMEIRRSDEVVFTGSTDFAKIKRSFDELVAYLFRNQSFPVGVFLLTGTGIVPPEGFSLQRGDEIHMEVTEIGVLSNRVR